jgi:hypothetical protein
MANPREIIRADREGRCALCRECGKVVNVTTRGADVRPRRTTAPDRAKPFYNNTVFRVG